MRLSGRIPFFVQKIDGGCHGSINAYNENQTLNTDNFMLKSLTILPALFAALLLVFTPVMTANAGIMPEKMTIRQENELGQNFDIIIRSAMPMVGDTYITDYVTDLVNRVVAAKKPMPFRIRSAVVANPVLNAFAIPGGYIYIFTGLILEVDNESEIVGVIAHELAHVSQRHVASRMEKQAKIGMLSMAGTLAGLFLGVAANNSGALKASQALMMGSQGIATAAMLQYSQDDEREADHVGLNSLVKAGYNPKGMPRTFELMRKNRWFDSGVQMPTYLSTHPGLSERITYLNDRIKRMPEVFVTRKDDNNRLKQAQMLIRSKLSPETTALAYYRDMKQEDFTPLDYVGRGIVQERLKDRAEALKSFEQALHLDGESPLIAREAGIFFFKSGDTKRSFKYLQRAIIKNNRDALGLFYYAKLQNQMGNPAQAAQTLHKVNELVPEDWEVYKELGNILGNSGDEFSGNLNYSYSALYAGSMKKARYHYQRAAALAKTDEHTKELEKLNAAIESRAKFVK